MFLAEKVEKKMHELDLDDLLNSAQIDKDDFNNFISGNSIIEPNRLYALLDKMDIPYEKNKEPSLPYLVNKTNISKINSEAGFNVNKETILDALTYTNNTISTLPAQIFQSIDFKSISGIIGALFAKGIELSTNAIVNPIEKGYPDILPDSVDTSPSNPQLMNYPKGIEIKCTLPGTATGNNGAHGVSRVSSMNSITWQAHHREGKKLLGLVWDFVQVSNSSYNYPAVIGAFYTDQLVIDDWGKISGTSGRNTKVSGMTASGKSKMGHGVLAMINIPTYIIKMKKILKF